MKNYTIREVNPEEINYVSELVRKVFKRFVAPDFSGDGVRNFNELLTIDCIKARLAENARIFVACYEKQIIGVMEIRDYSHIVLLFTAEEWQGCGIARNLLDTAIYIFREEGRTLSQITVNSSPYAVSIYKKLGFIISSQEQFVKGFRFTPMVKQL